MTRTKGLSSSNDLVCYIYISTCILQRETIPTMVCIRTTALGTDDTRNSVIFNIIKVWAGTVDVCGTTTSNFDYRLFDAIYCTRRNIAQLAENCRDEGDKGDREFHFER